MRYAMLLATICLASTFDAAAHGGGLDANGCHHDRKNGGYHCHRAPTAAAPPRSAPNSMGSQLSGTPGRAGSVYFRNCSEARAAGAAPVRRGQPGYGPHLDRDADGVGCE